MDSSIHSPRASFVRSKVKPVGEEALRIIQDLRPSLLSSSVNDSPFRTFDEVYSKESLLAEGGFAIVYHCKHKVNEKYYALKEVFNNEYDAEGANNLKEEIAAMKLLRESPYIVRLFDVFYEKDRTLLVMEEMKGGDLLDRIVDKKQYDVLDAKKVCRQLLQAVRVCHMKHIAHRDIKPENVLLVHGEDDTTIKLCDFGCARRVTEPNSLKTLAGSPQYAAPEVFDHTEKGGYGLECDMWSVGCVLYTMLGGYCPFEGDTVIELAQQICSGDWDSEFKEKEWAKVRSKPKEFIRNLLVVDPSKRYTIEQALDSEWIRRDYMHRSESEKAIRIEHSPLPTKLAFHQTHGSFDPDALEGVAEFRKTPTKASTAWIPKSPQVQKLSREIKASLKSTDMARRKSFDSFDSSDLLPLHSSDDDIEPKTSNRKTTSKTKKSTLSLPKVPFSDD